MNTEKIKVDCLITEKKSIGGLWHIDYIPISYINEEYGNLNNYLNMIKGTIFEPTKYKIEKSNCYNDCYNDYIKNDKLNIIKNLINEIDDPIKAINEIKEVINK